VAVFAGVELEDAMAAPGVDIEARVSVADE